MTDIIDPDYQRLNSEAIDHVSGSLQCGTFLSEVIAVRNYWRRFANGDYVKGDEAKELFGLAVESLGPIIHEAIRRQREHDQLTEQARVERDAPRRTWPSQADAMDAWTDRVAAAKAENGGCCGGISGGPDETGYCFSVGYCPMLQEARACERFIAGYLEWLDTIQEQAALADVAARLSEPVLGEMNDVCISDG